MKRISGFLMLACCLALPFELCAREFRTGDLLFFDLDCGQLCDSIETATQRQFGVDAPALSHVGMVIVNNGRTYLVEAYGDVGLTPLSEALSRAQNGRFLKIRKGEIPTIEDIPAARLKKTAMSYIGLPYDDVFAVDNGRYYCSELIYEIFRAAGAGGILELRPMEYGETCSAERLVWGAYFRKLGVPVPEGRPGISPLGIWLALTAP